MAIDLPFIWAGVIAFAVLAYVMLDGFDLGVGILFPLAKNSHDRDVMMNSVAPVWDGNETWLVLGGGGLMAVFPLAYAIVHARPLCAPHRHAAWLSSCAASPSNFAGAPKRGQFLWDWAFSGGSLDCDLRARHGRLAHWCRAFRWSSRAYAGGWWDWVSPFSFAHRRGAGRGLCAAGCHLAGDENRRRTAGKPHASSAWITGARHHCSSSAPSACGRRFWNPLHRPLVCLSRHALQRHRAAAGAGLRLRPLSRACATSASYRPFLSPSVCFILCFVGLGISFYPYIVPPSLSIWDAAAPDKSLGFLLVGALVLVPLILAYTAYSYWVFRGKAGIFYR